MNENNYYLDQQFPLSLALSQSEDNNAESQPQINNRVGGGGGGDQGAEDSLPHPHPHPQLQPQIQHIKIDLDGLLQQKNNSYLDNIFSSTIEFNADGIIFPEVVRKKFTNNAFIGHISPLEEYDDLVEKDEDNPQYNHTKAPLLAWFPTERVREKDLKWLRFFEEEKNDYEKVARKAKIHKAPNRRKRVKRS